MEATKFNEATAQRPQAGRPPAEPVMVMDLPFFMLQLKTEPSWQEGDRNATVVYKTEHITEILVALRKDANITKGATDAVIKLQVLEGNVLFEAEEHSVRLYEGQMLALQKNVAYSIKALEESVFLLTLTYIMF